MKYRSNVLERIATLLIYSGLIGLSLLCIAPIIHILAVSFSAAWAAEAGEVAFWPVGFTLQSYEYVFNKPQFIASVIVTIQRVVLGVSISMLLTVIAAYPLSKESRAFRFRTFYAWTYVFTILFSGGLIPWYMTIRSIGMLDSLWALVIPGAVAVFNIIVLLNFFRNLPRELEESAFVDGAQHWTILFRIFIPLSKPALATLTLFCVVGHWNSWFDGLILMNSPDRYPLSSYLQTVVIGRDLSQMTAHEVMRLTEISNRTFKAAQIFMGALPVLLLYPFLQKYFAKGIVLGSVKG